MVAKSGQSGSSAESGKDAGCVTRPCTESQRIVDQPLDVIVEFLIEGLASESAAGVRVWRRPPRDSLELRAAHHTASPDRVAEARGGQACVSCGSIDGFEGTRQKHDYPKWQ